MVYLSFEPEGINLPHGLTETDACHEKALDVILRCLFIA